MLQKVFLFSISILFSASLLAQHINGVVIDANDKSPLPFATVSFLKALNGSLTNEQGEFTLNIKDVINTDTLQVSFMGYKSYKIALANINGTVNIELKASSINLNAVLISPQEPIWYIKQAIKNRINNYPQSNYQSYAYYIETIKENNHYTKFTEAVFKSLHPTYSDTSKSKHQLMLFRTADNIEEMQFMRERIEKQNRKKRKKAEKKGKEYDEDLNAVKASFGGPDNILGMDIVKTAEQFLDSTSFEKYNYTFNGASTYGNHQVVVIAFNSKRKLDHMKQKGNIYIDIYSDAIVGIDFYADFVIPAYIKPFLFAMGLSIKKPYVNGKSRYLQVDETMYPANFQWKMNADVTKKYMFKKNEHASFEVEQAMSVNQIKPAVTTAITKGKQFNVKKKMPEQIFNDGEIEWDQVNAIKISY